MVPFDCDSARECNAFASLQKIGNYAPALLGLHHLPAVKRISCTVHSWKESCRPAAFAGIVETHATHAVADINVVTAFVGDDADRQLGGEHFRRCIVAPYYG